MTLLIQVKLEITKNTTKSDCNRKIKGVSKDMFWAPNLRLYIYIFFFLTPLTPVIEFKIQPDRVLLDCNI